MTWRELITVAGMTLVTFGVRYPVLALVSRFTLPAWLGAALRFVPPAVLTAIIVPALLVSEEHGIWLSPENAYLVAGLVAIAVALTARGGTGRAVGMALALATSPPILTPVAGKLAAVFRLG